MKTSVETLETAKVKLSIEVPFEEFSPEIDKAAKKVSKQVNIPGFRKGRVPRRVLEAQFGLGALVQEALNDSLDGYYSQALQKEDLRPLSAPEVDVTDFPVEKGSETPLKFNVTVCVRPEIVLPDFANYTLDVDAVEVSDEDVEERLTSLRERFSTLKEVERAIEDNDYCTIDLVAEIDGEEVDRAEGVSYQIGSGRMLPGIDDALKGAKAGETVTFTSTLAGGEHEGEEGDVSVTVSSVKESELPEVDEDFVQLASEFDTVEELREDLRNQVEKDKKTNQVYAAREDLVKRLSEEIDVPVHSDVIDNEIKHRLEVEGKEVDDEHAEELRKDVEESMKTQLILDVISERFNVTIEQDELVNSLVEQAQMYGIDPNQFIQMAVQTNQITSFADELRRGKGVLSALRLVNVVDSEGDKVDVVDVIGEAPEGEIVPDFSQQTTKKESANDNSDDDSFDPSQHSVADVKKYLADADDEEKARVITLEKDGKARKGILDLA